MKTVRIVNRDRCVYVERRVFRCWWMRVSPKYKTNIEAYNWIRSRKDVELVKRK